MSENIDFLNKLCGHAGCTDNGGREVYCVKRGEREDGDVSVVLDQLKETMYVDIDVATEGIGCTVDSDDAFITREFRYLTGDLKTDAWPITEKRVRITQQMAK